MQVIKYLPFCDLNVEKKKLELFFLHMVRL